MSFIGKESVEKSKFTFDAFDNLFTVPMKRLLITGCNGLLGSELIERFSERFIILGLDFESPLGKRWKCQFVEQDLTNFEGLKSSFAEFAPELVINAAAFTDVDGCERDRKRAWEVNVKGVENIASICSEVGCKLVHISTDYVFDGRAGPYSEEDPPSPCNYYGMTKLEGERVLGRFPLDYVIVRTSALYGLPRGGKKGFFGFLLEGLSRGEVVYGFIDQFTTPTWVGDLVKGIMEAVGERGIFHISGGKFLSRFDFAQKVAQVFGYDPNLVKPEETASVRFVANRPPKGGLRVDKARRVLGYTPHSITEALETIKKERDEGER